MMSSPAAACRRSLTDSLPLEVLNECLGYCSLLSLLRLAATSQYWRWLLSHELRAVLTAASTPSPRVACSIGYREGVIGALIVNNSGATEDVTHPQFSYTISKFRFNSLIPSSGRVSVSETDYNVDRFKWSPLRRVQYALWAHIRRYTSTASAGLYLRDEREGILAARVVLNEASDMMLRIENLAWLELYRNALQGLVELDDECCVDASKLRAREKALAFVKEWARLRALETSRMINLAAEAAEELEVPAALLKQEAMLRIIEFPTDPATGEFVTMASIRKSLRVRSLDCCAQLEIDVTEGIEPYENVISCHIKATARDVVEANAAHCVMRNCAVRSQPGRYFSNSARPKAHHSAASAKSDRLSRQFENTNTANVAGKPGTLHRNGQSGAKDGSESWEQRMRRFRALRSGV